MGRLERSPYDLHSTVFTQSLDSGPKCVCKNADINIYKMQQCGALLAMNSAVYGAVLSYAKSWIFTDRALWRCAYATGKSMLVC